MKDARTWQRINAPIAIPLATFFAGGACALITLALPFGKPNDWLGFAGSLLGVAGAALTAIFVVEFQMRKARLASLDIFEELLSQAEKAGTDYCQWVADDRPEARRKFGTDALWVLADSSRALTDVAHILRTTTPGMARVWLMLDAEKDRVAQIKRAVKNHATEAMVKTAVEKHLSVLEVARSFMRRKLHE